MCYRKVLDFSPPGEVESRHLRVQLSEIIQVDIGGSQVLTALTYAKAGEINPFFTYDLFMVYKACKQLQLSIKLNKRK